MERPALLRNRRHAIAAVITLLVAAAAVPAWRRFPPAAIVQVAIARTGTVAEQVTGPGTVQARVPVTLSARLTSTVVHVNADVGDPVRAGQELVVLDGRDLAARHAAALRQEDSMRLQVTAAAAAVEKARADLDLARARERRDADLHAQRFLSGAALDASVAAARSAQANLEGADATLAARRADLGAIAQEIVVARTQVGFTRLSAPMAGVVVQRLVEPGTTVGPGTPILRLVDPRSLWVAARIDEAQVDRVRTGQAATIRLRSGSVVAGRVDRIALQSDAATRELKVNVAFVAPPSRVAIDQEAEVRIETGRERGIVVPAGAVLQAQGGTASVLRIEDGVARKVAVELGPRAPGMALVRAGLAEGDMLVADAARVKPGSRVRPAP